MFRKFALTTTALVFASVAIAVSNPVWAQDVPQPTGQAACGEQAEGHRGRAACMIAVEGN